MATSSISHTDITGIKTVSDSVYMSFNDLVKYGNGLFSIHVADNNTPDNGNNQYWYVLQICFYASNQFCVQIATSSHGIDYNVYMRKATGVNTWSSWKKVTLS
jgi:sugar phosphate isomerase/epimerase